MATKKLRKVQGFFGIKRGNRPKPFGDALPYVVEITDEGAFFFNANGKRTPTNGASSREAFIRHIRNKDWLKFSKGNPFAHPDNKVQFHLQTWNEGGQEVIAGVKSKPHWDPRFIYRSERAARIDKKRFEADGTKWRILKRTEEVLP